VQPYLHIREAHKMIPFMETVFGAEALGVHKSPEGIVHTRPSASETARWKLTKRAGIPTDALPLARVRARHGYDLCLGAGGRRDID